MEFWQKKKPFWYVTNPTISSKLFHATSRTSPWWYIHPHHLDQFSNYLSLLQQIKIIEDVTSVWRIIWNMKQSPNLVKDNLIASKEQILGGTIKRKYSTSWTSWWYCACAIRKNKLPETDHFLATKVKGTEISATNKRTGRELK